MTARHLSPQDAYEDVSDEFEGQCEYCGAADGDGHSRECEDGYDFTREDAADRARELAREDRYK